MKQLANAMVRELPRILAIAIGSLVLAIAVNAFHSMHLPLLTAQGQPGLPGWVRSRFHAVNARQAVRLMENPEVLVVDTRDTGDFLKEHIAGAISLPYHGFNDYYPQFAGSVSKDRPVLLYCYGTDCGLAARVGKRLITDGYTDVTILRQGIEAWKAANLPLEIPEEHDEN